MLGLLMLLAAPATAGESGTITVVAAGIETARGTVLVQLANSAADYASDDDAFRFAAIPAATPSVTTMFAGVPYGDYAVKVFHDENDNKKIDMGWRGPTERYGFSNNARGLMGPPSFADARVTLESAALRLAIELK
jgi:uncharacterized protein (DUF2141 family)